MSFKLDFILNESVAIYIVALICVMVSFVVFCCKFKKSKKEKEEVIYELESSGEDVRNENQE